MLSILFFYTCFKFGNCFYICKAIHHHLHPKIFSQKTNERNSKICVMAILEFSFLYKNQNEQKQKTIS